MVSPEGAKAKLGSVQLWLSFTFSWVYMLAQVRLSRACEPCCVLDPIVKLCLVEQRHVASHQGDLAAWPFECPVAPLSPLVTPLLSGSAASAACDWIRFGTGQQ